MRRRLLILLLLVVQASSLKFLAYNPRIGTSHFTYISRIAEALVEAGHEVVMLATPLSDKVNIMETKGARVITDVLVSEEGRELADTAMSKATDLFWTYKSDMDFAAIYNSISRASAAQCNATIHTPGLIERLRAEKFDAAFTETIDLCGMGIIHLLGIKKYAMVLSVSSTDGAFAVTGVPTNPSYVPGGMADFGEKMTFLQRLLNTVSLGMMPFFFASTRARFQAVFDPFHPGMPQLKDIIANSSLFFPNCVPLTDFPRPTSHKTIEIGGITVSSRKEELDEKWRNILGLRNHTVLLSFGSAAQANRMPEVYKKAIRAMVHSLPQVTFIVKYENPDDGFSKDLPNMIESAWVPQQALLKDARLSAFITHGGAGSTTEGTHAGVPLIVVPLMGDQLRNGHLIERLGTGINLPKASLASATALTAAVERIIGEKRFKQKALLVASQLRNQPFTPHQKVVRNMEFMARYGPLTMLDHYGKQLNFFQYYLLDVVAFISLKVVIGLVIVVVAIRCAIRSIHFKFVRKTKNE